MNAKTELVALAVRYLTQNTNIIARPDTFTEFFATLSTGKTFDVRTAESIIETSEKAAQTAKRVRTNRKFKKITANV